MHLRRSLVTCTLAVGLLAAPGAAHAACTVTKSTAYDNPAEGNSASSVYGGQELAQSFKVPAAVTLHHVSLELANIGATDDAITVEIRSDSAGKPGAVLATRTATLTNATVAFTDFDFSSANLALAAGTPYFIVAINTAAAQLDGYTWQADGTGASYPDGNSFFSGTSGATWTSTTFDQLFQVFGQTCVADQPAPDTVKPTVSKLGFSSKRFRAASKGGAVASKKAPVGTRVTYKLSEAAKAKFTVERALKGRKSGKKSVAPTKKNRHKKSCTRYKQKKGSFTLSGKVGSNSFKFTGRLRGRKLAPGRYRLVMVATDGAGNKSKAKRASFTIVRR